MLGGFHIASAVAADSDAVFALRNAPDVRQASLNTAPLDPDKHAEWFTAMLQHPAREMWILHRVSTPGTVVGFIRLDAYLTGIALISIVLAPSARGKGLAVPFIHDVLARTDLSIHRVVAQVKVTNLASVRTFRRAGFTPIEHVYDEVQSFAREIFRPGTDVIDQIEAVRARNNTTWMDVLRLAWKHAPDETAVLLQSIHAADSEISALVAKLTEGRGQ